MTEQITEKQARERLVNAGWTQGEVEDILRELFPPVPRVRYIQEHAADHLSEVNWKEGDKELRDGGKYIKFIEVL